MKKLVVIFIVILLGGVAGFYLTKAKSKTLNDVWAHFEKSGLSVQDLRLTPEEQALVDNAKKAATLLGAGKNAPKSESKTKIVNSIQVKITRYENAAASMADYNKKAEQEKTKKDRRAKENTPYYRNDFYLNGPFIMQVYFFDVDKNLTPSHIEIDQTELERVVSAFKSI